MTTSINTNVSAYFAQNNLRSSSAQAQSSIARLSSGNRIIRASDDVAALSIGTVLRTDVSTLKTALSNTSQAISLIQVADGALQRLGEIFQRQKALSTQGNADTLSNTERGYLDQEFQALVSEYDRIVSKTNFNGIALLNGSLAASSTSLATEFPAAAADFVAALTDADVPVDTAVFATAAGAITVQTLGNNDRAFGAIQGSLAGVNVTVIDGAATDDAAIILEINGVIFKSTVSAFQLDDANATLDLTQELTDIEETGTTNNTAMVIRLNVADLNLGATSDAQDAEDAAQAIQTNLRKLTIYQDRAIENTLTTDSSAITTDAFQGTVLAGMDGADFVLRTTGFDATTGYGPGISNFVVESLSSTLARFSVQIGGVTYSSDNVSGNENGVTVDADISDNNLGSANGILRLTSANDSNSFIDIDLTQTISAGDISITSDEEAAGLQDALNGGFGAGTSGGGAAFQVGTDSDDTIAVSITNVSSTSVFKDNDGVSTVLSVDTKANSITASGILDNAINTLTSVRAQVGAVQSRFNFAAATLETSVQNLDSARAGFLDADISNESTAFASQQVLIQASISVLAQANQ